ncbi:MAG: T9SS type A sorting domain-containing protein, partial [Anaerolineales bacterium]|nr:T9SS type A sorting domain-containing protein [Anaerolineales bacterium]
NFVSNEMATGYSVDNIAPDTPSAFSGVYDENKAVLSWAPSEANDISYYNVYRNDDTVPITTTETSFTDDITEDTQYQVSAVDIHENESGMSESVLVSPPLNVINNLIPLEYALMHAYPNPFNPVTNITYGLPEYTKVQIVIFDLSGNKVESLINEFQEVGYHSVDWHADNHPSGLYFVKMIAGEYISTQKLMLVK